MKNIHRMKTLRPMHGFLLRWVHCQRILGTD